MTLETENIATNNQFDDDDDKLETNLKKNHKSVAIKQNKTIKP